MSSIWPENLASPWPLIVTGSVSSTASIAAPKLHTSVPSICVIGPAVPLKDVPLMTSPLTLKLVSPVARSTRAVPLRADHAKVPLSIVVPTQRPCASLRQIGLSTFCAVITPTTVRQRTVELPFIEAAPAVAARARNKSPVKAVFMASLHSVVCRPDLHDPATNESDSKKTTGSPRDRGVPVSGPLW